MLSSADLLDQLEPAHVGHLQIRDDQVVAALVQLLERQRAVLDGVHDVPLHGQEVGQDLADHLLVVDDEDPGSLQHRDVVRPLAPVGGIVRVGSWLSLLAAWAAEALASRASRSLVLKNSPERSLVQRGYED